MHVCYKAHTINADTCTDVLMLDQNIRIQL